MVRKKRGWWSQIQSGDYPETQKKYGDNNWVGFNVEKNNSRKSGTIGIIREEPRVQFQKECPKCGELYWIDKGRCYNCGWGHRFNNESNRKLVTETNIKEIVKNINSPKINYSMLCPRCGKKMVLRVAKKGKNKGSKFWGCSQFPKCRGTSRY